MGLDLFFCGGKSDQKISKQLVLFCTICIFAISLSVFHNIYCGSEGLSSQPLCRNPQKSRKKASLKGSWFFCM
jgi:hypothetical protein